MTNSRIAAGGRTPPELRRTRLATATLFFANGCGLGSWIRMDLGTSPATAAWSLAAFSLTMAIGRFSGDRLVARFSPAAILVAGGVIAAAMALAR